MKFKAMLVPLLLVAVSVASAQEEAQDPNAWETSLEVSLGLTQATYSDNWTGGEVGSIVWTSNLYGTAQKQLSRILRSENALQLAFGQTHSQDEETKDWAAPAKSTDKIRFDTVLKFTLDAWLDPYAAGIFESQFYDASLPYDERYVNPIDLTESAGVSKTLIDQPSSKLATRLGLGLRQAIMQEGVDSAGVVIEESMTTLDGGIEWVTDWNATLSETLNYTTKLSVFQAFFYSESDELEGLPEADYWKTTDVAWENILTARVASIVQVSLAWELHYDKQKALGGRFKETLALGVAYVM
jgi:hypothetical protein